MSAELPTKDWVAWHDFMPGSPPTLHVKGVVTCPTTGYKAVLKPSVPQGFNPAIYLLDLVITKPGPNEIVHQTVTDLTVHYREDTSNSYSQVTIQPEGVTVDVSIAS